MIGAQVNISAHIESSNVSARVPALVPPRITTSQVLADRWNLGEAQCGARRTLPSKRGARPTSECRNPRHPVSKDFERRRRARIRRSEEVEREKSPSFGRYARDGTQNQGARGRLTGSGGSATGAGGHKGEVPSLRACVGQRYTGFGRKWIEEQLGWGVEVVKHPPKRRVEWRPIGDLDDLSSVWFEWVRVPAEPKRFRSPLTLGAGARNEPSVGSLRAGGLARIMND